jgi:hypothetical protein
VVLEAISTFKVKVTDGGEEGRIGIGISRLCGESQPMLVSTINVDLFDVVRLFIGNRNRKCLTWDMIPPLPFVGDDFAVYYLVRRN